MGLLIVIKGRDTPGRYDDRPVVVNVEGPFGPTAGNAYLLKLGPTGVPIIVPAVEVLGEWVELKPADLCGPMDSGDLADTSDGRWNRAVRAMWAEQAKRLFGLSHNQAEMVSQTIPTAVSVHDRYETWDQYERMSR